MSKKSIVLSVGIVVAATLTPTIINSISHSDTFVQNTRENYPSIPTNNYSYTTNYSAYSTNFSSLDEASSKLKQAIEISKIDAEHYKKIVLNANSRNSSSIIKSAKDKALHSKQELLKLKSEIEKYKESLNEVNKKNTQKRIDKQQLINKNNILKLTKNIKILNQGNVKNSVIINTINKMEESKFQIWKLEEYTNVNLPETEKGTTIDEVKLSDKSNGNIDVELKLFTKYATNKIEIIHFTLKGKTDSEASKSNPPKKLETKQEKAERLTKEYNDEVDVYIRLQKNYNDHINSSQAIMMKHKKAFDAEKIKLNNLRDQKNLAKVELRRTIFHPIVSSLLDSAWIVNQGSKKVSEIANEINSLNDLGEKIDSMQKLFGIKLFKKDKSFNLDDIKVTPKKDGTIKIELLTSMDYVSKFDKIFTRVLRGKSDAELKLEETERYYDASIKNIQKALNISVNKKSTATKKPKDTNPEIKSVDKKDSKSPSSKKTGSNNLGLIIGAVIGGIVIIGAIIGFTFFRKKHKKQ